MTTKSLPADVVRYFDRAGIDTGRFIAAVKGDFDKDYNYTDIYTAFDKDNLYILSGKYNVSKNKRGRLLRVFELDELKTIKIKGIDKLFVERNLGTARLVMLGDSGVEVLMTFSLNLAQYFEQFCKMFGFNKEGDTKSLSYEKEIEDRYCPKCGKRYPDQSRSVCPMCTKSSGIMWRLLALTKDYKWTIMLVLLSAGLMSVLSVVWTHVAVKMFYDEVLEVTGKFYGNVIMVVGILLAFRVIDALFRIVYSSLMAKASAKIVYDLKMRIFSSMQKLGLSFFSNKQTGDLMTRVNNDTNAIYWFLVDFIPYTFISVLQVAVAITILFSINLYVGLIIIAAVPLYIIIMRLFFLLEGTLYRKKFVYSALENAYVNDSINGQRIIKTFSKESHEVDRFSKLENRTNHNEKTIKKIEFMEYPLTNLIFKACQMGAIFVGAMFMLEGKITLGATLSITSYTSMIFNPLDFFAFLPSGIAWVVDSASRIFEVGEAVSDCEPPLNPVTIEDFRGEIKIDNVSFNYDMQRPIIKNLSLDIKAGQMLGIAGKSGAGKTTLINLMARLYDAKSGAIYIDGVNVKDIDPQILRKNIGIVSQESYLFIGSIADNIRYADKKATMEQVIAAAKAANAHDFIMRMPDGYETLVGEGGQDLSGGEKQRVSIARAILQNPKILILDEATAAMDTKTERSIQKSLDSLKAGRTTIAIAHRLSTLRDADVLAVIENGELKEYGTHNELLKKQGVYFELFKIQAEALKFMAVGAEGGGGGGGKGGRKR